MQQALLRIGRMGDLCARWRASDLKPPLVTPESETAYMSRLIDYMDSRDPMPPVVFVERKKPVTKKSEDIRKSLANNTSLDVYMNKK